MENLTAFLKAYASGLDKVKQLSVGKGETFFEKDVIMTRFPLVYPFLFSGQSEQLPVRVDLDLFPRKRTHALHASSLHMQLSSVGFSYTAF